MSKSVLSMLSSRSFMVWGCTVKSLIHFEFTFIYGVKKQSSLIHLHVAFLFSQHRVSKRLSFPQCTFLNSFTSSFAIYNLLNSFSLISASRITNTMLNKSDESVHPCISPELDIMLLAVEYPWTEEPGGLQSIALQRARHD